MEKRTFKSIQNSFQLYTSINMEAKKLNNFSPNLPKNSIGFIFSKSMEIMISTIQPLELLVSAMNKILLLLIENTMSCMLLQVHTQNKD